MFEMTPALAAKIGSIVVHVEEALSPGGHEFDLEACRSLVADEEVLGWLEYLRGFALIPVKRDER